MRGWRARFEPGGPVLSMKGESFLSSQISQADTFCNLILPRGGREIKVIRPRTNSEGTVGSGSIFEFQGGST